jgi:hypothetical protein
MSDQRDPQLSQESMVYQIRLEGHLNDPWGDWLGGVTIVRDANGETLVTCPVADQAALYGLLRKVRDVGLTLISINRIDA